MNASRDSLKKGQRLELYYGYFKIVHGPFERSPLDVTEKETVSGDNHRSFTKARGFAFAHWLAGLCKQNSSNGIVAKNRTRSFCPILH